MFVKRWPGIVDDQKLSSSLLLVKEESGDVSFNTLRETFAYLLHIYSKTGVHMPQQISEHTIKTRKGFVFVNSNIPFKTFFNGMEIYAKRNKAMH